MSVQIRTCRMRSAPAAQQSGVIRHIYDGTKEDMEEVSSPCSAREWGFSAHG